MLKSLYFIAFICISGAALGQDTQSQKALFYKRTGDSLKSSNSVDTVYINRRKAHSQFNDDISGSIFLSKASFYLNKRWTSAEFPNRYPMVLDSRVNPYINISSENWNLGGTQNALMFALYFNPDFEVRIFENQAALGDKSHPVRTASFRPGGELFLSTVKLYHPARRTKFAASFKFNHHSDGQDGEEFNTVDQPWGKKGYANTYNGDFSDDFLLGANLLVFHRSKAKFHSFSGKLGFSSSTGLSEGLKRYNVYGKQRINLFANWAFLPNYRTYVNGTRIPGNFHVERARLELYASMITNSMMVGSIQDLRKATFADRFNFHITGHYRIPGFTAAGLFLEYGYYGQDLYNIYYQQSAWFYKIGVSFGLFKYTYPNI